MMISVRRRRNSLLSVGRVTDQMHSPLARAVQNPDFPHGSSLLELRLPCPDVVVAMNLLL